MVEVGTGGKSTRFVRSDYPVEEGLTAGTTKLRKKKYLKAEQKSVVRCNDRKGIY